MSQDNKKTITVNDIEYDLNDFTDEQKKLFNHVQDLDSKLSSTQFNMDQLIVSREAFIARLTISLETPVEAKIVDEDAA
jgi:hypothetical protein